MPETHDLAFGLTAPWPGSRSPRAATSITWHTVVPYGPATMALDAGISTAGSGRDRFAWRDSRSRSCSRCGAGKPQHATRRARCSAARLLNEVVDRGLVDTGSWLGRIPSGVLGELRGCRAQLWTRRL